MQGEVSSFSCAIFFPDDAKIFFFFFFFTLSFIFTSFREQDEAYINSL